MTREMTDLERKYYAVCDRAVALRRELGEAIAEIDALRAEIRATLLDREPAREG